MLVAKTKIVIVVKTTAIVVPVEAAKKLLKLTIATHLDFIYLYFAIFFKNCQTKTPYQKS
jgi:hypothetical protein